MALNNIVKIYSNDGSTLLFTSSETVGVAASQTVTETGVTLSSGEVYTYNGKNKFIGLAWYENQTTPNHPVGSTFTYSAPLYIVEEELPEEEPKVTITYNGSVIASLEAGQTATLQCNGKKMVGDVIVTAPEVAEPEVTDSPLPIEIETADEMTALLSTAEVGSVYKYTGTTSTYENGALYVVEENTVNITLKGYSTSTASQSFNETKIKFGSAPTSDSDYDYMTVQGGSNLYDRDGAYVTAPISLTVPPTAYVWQTTDDDNGGYKINNGSTVTTSMNYANATEVNLNDGDTITIITTFD